MESKGLKSVGFDNTKYIVEPDHACQESGKFSRSMDGIRKDS